MATKANSPDVPVATPVAAAPSADKISLTEFCTRLSETVRQPELIGGFEAVERAAGRVKASTAEFGARFDAFRNKPV